MVDVGVRDLGGARAELRPDGAAREPIPPTIPTGPKAASIAGGVVRAAPSLFGGTNVDALGLDDTLGRLAELAVHRGTAAGLCIGLLGGPGAGKSFALGRLTAHLRDLAAAAERVGGSPFLSRVHVQPIDAASLEGDPVTALAAKLHGGLRGRYPDFAREAGHAARDPHAVLREVNEKLDDARRRLDSERRALDDAGSRRARLVETVLYEAAGSQVDAYARGNRASLEARLAAFGIAGEPVRTFKDLVQLAAGGSSGLTLRAFWAFKGQTKLIVAAFALAALGIGLGIAIDDQVRWLDALRAAPQAGAGAADWAEAHMGLLATTRTLAFAGAGLALAANVVRAVAFLQPIGKGVRLLRADLDGRRRDLDGHYAHQTKRVDMLDADVERLTRESSEAERRAGGIGSGEAPSPFQPDASGQAQSFLALLGAMMAGQGRPSLEGQGVPAAPQRIVLAIDHLDALAPDRARAILDALHRSLGFGLVAIVTADPTRLTGAPEAAGRDALERWIQVPVRIDAGAAVRDYAPLVRATLGQAALGRPPEERTSAGRPDASASVLDQPVTEAEAVMLTALAGLAGRSPRAVKRFVDLYALGRHGADDARGPFALMLALALGGAPAEQESVAAALRGDAAAPFAAPDGGARLRAAIEAMKAYGGNVSVAEAAEAARRAAPYSLR